MEENKPNFIKQEAKSAPLSSSRSLLRLSSIPSSRKSSQDWRSLTLCLPRGPKLPGQKGNTVHRETAATNCLPSNDNGSLRALVHRNICLTKDSRKAINTSSDPGCKELQYSISTAPARPHIGPGESGWR